MMIKQKEANRNNISVSVAMCTYNGAAYIEEQLFSVLQQTYPLHEVLVYDDASTDETVSVLQRMALQYPIISLHINAQNVGFTRNFEQALLAANGDAIAICDQDDIWVKEKVEKMVGAWKPECPLIYCYSHPFQQELPVNPKLPAAFRRFQGTDARELCVFNTISGHNILLRKHLLQLVIPFSNKVHYDWWMAVVAACNGGVQYLPEALVYQRIHDNNKVTVDENKIDKDVLRAQRRQEMINNNFFFATAPNIPERYKRFFLKLAHLAQRSLQHRFYVPLFLFLVRYRHLIFYHKKKKMAFFSRVKHSYRRTITPVPKAL